MIIVRFFAFLVLVLLLIVTRPAVAADIAGAKDDPIAKRVEGSDLLYSKTTKFDSVIFRLERVEWDGENEKFKDSKKIVAEGPHTTLYYKLPKDMSPLEAARQYQADLKAKGADVLFDAEGEELDDGYGRFVEQTFKDAKKTKELEYLHDFNRDIHHYSAMKLSGPDGNVYVSVYAFAVGDFSELAVDQGGMKGVEVGRPMLRLDIVREGAMNQRMVVVKAAEINDSIARTGRIALYGIYFDTDKAVIKPESAATLAEMAAMLKGAGEGKFLIVGHTDNQGGLEYNASLSKRRAEAVVKALSGEHGVNPAQVISVGVGMAAPIAPNTTEDGRAKNRRVEIVAM